MTGSYLREEEALGAKKHQLFLGVGGVLKSLHEKTHELFQEVGEGKKSRILAIARLKH